MKLTGLTPNIVTANIDRSVAFYRDVLGFSVTITVPDAGPFVFVALQRDAVTVFLNDAEAAKKEAPADTSLVVGHSGVAMYVDVDQIAALWEQVRDTARVVMPLKQQWYGAMEFSVTDPDGYLITFAERT
jgi:glyoxylase I family protein